MRRGAWRIVVAVVVVVLVAGAATVARARLDGGPRAAMGPGYAANRAEAGQEAERLLEIVSLPPGARRTAEAPIASLARPCGGAGPSDSTLRRTIWWTVPEPGYAVSAWMRDHTPAGLTRPGDGGTCSTADNALADVIDWEGTGTVAYSAPILEAEWMATPGGTAVRADIYLAARRPRTADMSIPDQVTDVAITRTSTPTTGAHPTSQTVHRRVVDPAQTGPLVTAINALPGVAVRNDIGFGLGETEMRTYRVEADWPEHVMVGRIPAGGDLTLTLDGRRLEPDLEVGYDNHIPLLLDDLLQHP